MNFALFLLYLAGVAEMVQVLCVLALIAIVISGIFLGLHVIFEDEFELGGRVLLKVLPWIVALAIVSALMPSRHFMYIAAGLIAGEDIAQTEVAQKAYTLLNRQLDDMLAEDDGD